MPDVSENSIVAVTARYTHDGQENLNTWHFKFQTLGGIGANIGEVMDGVSFWVEDLAGPGNAFKDCITVDVVDIEWYAQVISLQRFPKRLVAGAASGSAVGAALPSTASHAITFRGLFAGRHYRGSKHIGGVPASFSSGSMLTTVGRDAYTAFADLMLLEQQGDGGGDKTYKPIIFNRDTPSSSVDVVDYIIGDTTRVQRRRTVGLGS